MLQWIHFYWMSSMLLVCNPIEIRYLTNLWDRLERRKLFFLKRLWLINFTTISLDNLNEFTCKYSKLIKKIQNYFKGYPINITNFENRDRHTRWNALAFLGAKTGKKLAIKRMMPLKRSCVATMPLFSPKRLL